VILWEISVNNALDIIDKKYKYILTLDDDTLLPENFTPNKEYFEDSRVSSIGFGIKMKDKNTYAEKLADFEYKLNSIRNYIKNNTSCSFIVGIAGLWRRNIFKKIININPTATKTFFFGKDVGYESPYAEDSYNGIINRLLGYKKKTDIVNFVESYAPPRFFYNIDDFKKSCNISGYNSLNHYSQRALRWYRSQLSQTPYELYLFFTYNATCEEDNIFIKIYKTIKYRLEVLWWIILIYFSGGMVINSYILVRNGAYMYWIYVHVCLYILGVLSGIIENYITLRDRNDLQITWDVILLYPFFTTFVAICRFIGLIGGLTYYIPFKSPFKYSFCKREIFCNRLNKNEINDIDNVVEIKINEVEEEIVELQIIDNLIIE